MHHLPRQVGVPVLSKLWILHEAWAEERDSLQTVASGYLEKLGEDLLCLFLLFLFCFFVPLFLLKYWYHL